jgi:ketol-acid reductoisomerase
MKTSPKYGQQCVSLKNIFKYMMEAGYYPEFEYSHIQFDLDGNIATVDSENGFASLRLFFSIDEEDYDIFLEASNLTMLKTYAVKPAIMDDRCNIVFSHEFMCENIKEFKKFFPHAIECMREALDEHKTEVRRIIMSRKGASKTIPAADEIATGINKKIFS